MALYSLARMTTATTGTGTITLGSAVSAYNTFANAGVTNGATVTYAIRDGANSEIGRGVYTSSGTTLTRAVILGSTNGGSAINLSGSAEVFITPAASDLVIFDPSDGSVFLGTAPNLVLGHTAALAHTGTTKAGLQVHGLGTNASQSLWRWSNGASGVQQTFVKSRGATVGTNTIGQTADSIVNFTARGADGTGYIAAAQITMGIEGTPGTNDMPGAITFSTTADGASTVTDRVVVGPDGVMRPNADNTYTLGKSGARWSEVWAANGTIQTSDERDKDIAARIPGETAAAAVDMVEPIMFRWKVGGHDVVVSDTETELDEEGVEHKKVLVVAKAGTRLHAGFVAQEVKAAMDAANVEFGAWGLEDKNDPNSRQWLRPDQLVPVLWSALRQSRSELAALKARIEALEAA
jgi:hypothetical protein